MIIGFKYVSEEQENKDFYIFPVGRISTNQFLLQQGRFQSGISKNFLTVRIAECWRIENLHLWIFLRTVKADALINALLHLYLILVSVTPKNLAVTV